MAGMKIRFIPIKHGDSIDFGSLGLFGISGSNKYLGFKAGRASKREGWLVIADDGHNSPVKRRGNAKP